MKYICFIIYIYIQIDCYSKYQKPSWYDRKKKYTHTHTYMYVLLEKRKTLQVYIV